MQIGGAVDKLEMPDEARTIIDLLESAGYKAYIVGGCVRDAILGRTPNDWDITTSATPEQTKAVMANAGIKTSDTGIKYGTVSVIIDSTAYETTTFRSDGHYSDGRHPDTVELLDCLDDDLARRDFTINAMAYNPRCGIVDLHGGRADLDAGELRCVGDPHTRFAEDALRILRGLRFAATFELEIASETAAAIHADHNLLAQVSAERIATDFCKLVRQPGAVQILLDYADVIAVFAPQIELSIGFCQHNRHHAYTVWEHCVRAMDAAPPDDLALRLAALFHDIGKPACFAMGADGEGHFYGHREVSADLFARIASALKLPRKLSDEVETLVRYHDANLPTTAKGWRHWALKFGQDTVRRILLLHRYDISALAPAEVDAALANMDVAQDAFEEAIADFEVNSARDLAIDGHDLMELGFAQGPALGAALTQLLEDIADGEVANEREPLLARAKELL